MTPASPPALELRDVRLVLAILHSGGLTRAAEQLHCTPSALSHRLADLERRLRTPLFHRRARRLVPTPAGEALRDGAAPLLERAHELEAAVRRTPGTQVASLRIATECFTCYHWLPQALQHFEREQPRVEVRIVLAATRRALAALAAGELDVALTDSPRPGAALVTQPLFDSALVAAVAPSHPWAARERVRPADFAGEVLLRYPVARRDSTLLHEILGPAGVEPSREELVELTEAILELVRAGRGVAVLPSWVVAPWAARREIAAVPLAHPAARRRWCAVTRRQQAADADCAALVAALRAMRLPGTTPVSARARPRPASSPARRSTGRMRAQGRVSSR